ncbi:ornithine cyclodeaminase family protein [Mesorhizobium sp. Cs1299R1N3]|uniref:ornithine cyclodeaminase family protein n=1 Tax=Mesorhizobium sp. Cs1299R1N3 TaxID=3015173 RepID=UPI00301DBCC2
MPTVRYLSRGDVLSLGRSLDVEICLARILIETEQKSAGQAVRMELSPSTLPGVLALMPAFRSGASRSFAAKVVSVMPENPKKGLSAHQGIGVLFDGDEGVVVGMVDAGALTELRTAGLTALASRTLATPGASRALIVGGGHQLLPHIRALSKIEWISSLAVWVRRPDAARQIERELHLAGLDIEIEPHIDSAVQAADIVTTITSASQPVIHREWLRPGTHLNAIGSSNHSVRELDKSVVDGCDLFVDDEASVKRLAGEFSGLAEYPAMTSLGSVLAGNASGRRNAESITVFKSVGIATQDLALMDGLLSLATVTDVGQLLEF